MRATLFEIVHFIFQFSIPSLTATGSRRRQMRITVVHGDPYGHDLMVAMH